MSTSHNHRDWGRVQPLWSPRRVLALALTLGLTFAGLIMFGAYSAARARDNCERIAKLEQVAITSDRRAVKLLFKPGGPGYAYYQAHPDERRSAVKIINEQIHDLKPSRCSLFY